MKDYPNYYKLKNAYINQNTKENFFIAYAVNGPIVNPHEGGRAGLPVDTPLLDSPVTGPSPLNNRWRYRLPYTGIEGIL